jgi:hypothetical protein
MMPDDPNPTIDRADNTIIPTEPIADAAQVSPDTDVVTPEGAASGALGSDTSPEAATLSPEELAGLSDQFAERGIDLGSLLGTMMAGASQAKAKPKPRPSVAGAKDDPETLMGKLAESLGLSPEALAKQLGPILKKMLAGQAAASSSKPRRKPKKDSAKPAAKPKPKPASKPKKDTAKPAAKPKPKPASKPKKDTAKPAAKPKPKPASKPKKDTAKPAAKPKPKPAAKPKPKSTR